jgi:4-amino-4-deoxy-L-arabinose transferase-like glycosyltransferase
VEPVVFEKLVAFTYRYTGEQLWIARIYSSLFWLIGGIFLFLLARDLVSFEGALVSTAYYLIFPYAIIGSRSFQPDILMVMLILSFWWAFARWMDRPTWTHAALAGLLGGLALYIKFTAAFFVIGAALGLVLSQYKFRDLFRNGQVWLLAFLGALPASLYLIYGLFIKGTLGGQFAGRFIPALLLNPFNYLQWAVKADMAAGGIFIMLALLGFMLTSDKRLRGLLNGLWIAYLAYALFFDYHIATHDYYHLPFIPIVAVSLAPLGSWFFARLAETTVQGYQRAAVYIILLFGLFIVVWNVRNQMKAVDYRPQAAMFAELGELLDGKTVVALTQDYGSRFEYWGWKTSYTTWPYVGDLTYANARGVDFSFDRRFERYSSKRDYFLVTDFEEFNRQPELKEKLGAFPVYAEGDGFLVFSLRRP